MDEEPAPSPPDAVSPAPSEAGAATSVDDSAPARPPRSRAAEYRQRRTKRKTPYKVFAAEAVVFIAVVVVIYLATAPKPPAPASVAPGGHTYPSQVRMVLSPPIVGHTNCGTSKNYTTEELRVNSTSVPLTTREITLVVVELGDGDFIDSVSTVPVVNATSVCEATPPVGGISWYAVLVSPSGTNIGSFTYSQGWAPVAGAPFPGPVTNGTSFNFVFAQSLVGLGYGVYVEGVVGGPLVSGLGIF